MSACSFLDAFCADDRCRVAELVILIEAATLFPIGGVVLVIRRLDRYTDSPRQHGHRANSTENAENHGRHDLKWYAILCLVIVNDSVKLRWVETYEAEVFLG